MVVSEGDTYEEALISVKSAIRFHIETFGDETFGSTGISVVNKINLLHKPLLRYQYFNDSIKNKKWHFFDFEITTCKTTRKQQKEGQFTTPVPVEP